MLLDKIINIGLSSIRHSNNFLVIVVNNMQLFNEIFERNISILRAFKI